ncbi:MAG: DNA-3-methyladenine glycosylase I [Solobacterium sp.]|nr:DNA-3-methyladenine glycosylase I [Solobacterium sp.]
MSDCGWKYSSEAMKIYHDEEWGTPAHDDRLLFEYLFLECMQCGLSWDLMMKKREIFRECFDQFDWKKIMKYTDGDVDRIMNVPGMIRSPQKIRAMIGNAVCFDRVVEEYGSFDAFLWAYTRGRTLCLKGHEKGRIPVSDGLSAKIAKEMKRRGFRYLGPVTVYSYLQACGLINDHLGSCACYSRIISRYPVIFKRGYREVF